MQCAVHIARRESRPIQNEAAGPAGELRCAVGVTKEELETAKDELPRIHSRKFWYAEVQGTAPRKEQNATYEGHPP